MKIVRAKWNDECFYAALDGDVLRPLRGEPFERIEEDGRSILLAQAQLEVDMVQPKSVCNDCGTEFDHDRFHVLCPLCEGANTTLIAGRELKIESIEVDLPD